MRRDTLYSLRIQPSDSYRISITFTEAVFRQSFSARLKCTYGLCPWSYLRRNLHTSNPFSPSTNENVPDASGKSETHSVISPPGVCCDGFWDPTSHARRIGCSLHTMRLGNQVWLAKHRKQLLTSAFHILRIKLCSDLHSGEESASTSNMFVRTLMCSDWPKAIFHQTNFGDCVACRRVSNARPFTAYGLARRPISKLAAKVFHSAWSAWKSV